MSDYNNLQTHQGINCKDGKGKQMTWLFDGRGKWEAESVHELEEYAYIWWEIDVCKDGTFTIENSCLDLLDNDYPKSFATLAEAKAYCEKLEENYGKPA